MSHSSDGHGHRHAHDHTHGADEAAQKLAQHAGSSDSIDPTDSADSSDPIDPRKEVRRKGDSP